MSEDLRPGFGGALEGAPPSLVNQRRQRKLARDAASYLEEGEKLLAPAAFGARRGGILVLSAVGALVVTMVMLVVAGDRMGAAADVVFGAGLALTMLLLLVVAVPFTQGCAVVLTDRRLVAFRTGKFSSRVREMVIAVPRSEVFTAFWGLRRPDRGAGYGVLRLAFSPALGRAPMKPYFMAWNAVAAGCIDDALTTPAGGTDAASWPVRAA